jgi:hypothetical protein
VGRRGEASGSAWGGSGRRWVGLGRRGANKLRDIWGLWLSGKPQRKRHCHTRAIDQFKTLSDIFFFE